MKRIFKNLRAYINLHDGSNKPKINFQDMYKLFPEFKFESCENFGEYQNFGKAFECKIYDMKVTTQNNDECRIIYREYMDANENLAYLS